MILSPDVGVMMECVIADSNRCLSSILVIVSVVSPRLQVQYSGRQGKGKGKGRTPFGIWFPAMVIPSGVSTRLASGMVNTGVIRKFSFMQSRRYGKDASTRVTGYAG
jgi:hypothetical protein